MKILNKFGEDHNPMKGGNIEKVKINTMKDEKTKTEKVEKRSANLAELICYYHSKGTTMEELVEISNMEEEFVSQIIREAKSVKKGNKTLYDFLVKSVEDK